MAVVFLTGALAEAADGERRVEVTGATLRQVIAALDAKHPGLGARLAVGDELAVGLVAAIDGEIAPRALWPTVGPTSEVHFLPALAGG
ncbi:MAG: MoaD/ThiS family protein [Planctomycetia bacterium]